MSSVGFTTFPRSTHILIVDDMATTREMVRMELKALGYENLTSTRDGMEAMEILQSRGQNKPPIDLIVSDWNMPRKNGFELLKFVRTNPEYSHLPFILLTTESEKDLITEALAAGASQYILKPFTAKVFQEKLSGLWQKLQKNVG